eukprot:4367523-Ditylum_brightwellii.AAC.1
MRYHPEGQDIVIVEAVPVVLELVTDPCSPRITDGVCWASCCCLAYAAGCCFCCGGCCTGGDGNRVSAADAIV